MKAMRLAGVRDTAAANRPLDESFLASFNERFAVPPAEAADAHRPAAADLGEVLCEHHERRVGRDWCVRRRGTLLQIDKQHEASCLAGKRVTLRKLADGTLQVLWQGQRLSWRRVTERPRRPGPKPAIVSNRRYTPPASHPWKAGLPAARASSPTAPQPLRRDMARGQFYCVRNGDSSIALRQSVAAGRSV